MEAKRPRNALEGLGSFRNASRSAVQEILDKVRQQPEILDASEAKTAYQNALHSTLD
jgi:hypothetical protein